jgi:glycopeptide antibiotics resistance protein
MDTLLYYLYIVLPFAVLGALVFAAVYVPRRRRLDRMGLESSLLREGLLLAFYAYCGALFVLLFLPDEFDLLKVLAHGYGKPFFRPGDISTRFLLSLRHSRLMLWGNILVMVPLGFFPPLLWRDRHWYGALLLAVMVPAIAENWQLFIGRTFDVDDLLLNAMGIMLGWLLWNFLERPAAHCEEKWTYDPADLTDPPSGEKA